MKKLLFIPLVFLCLFLITNPSVKSFKDHLGRNTYAGLVREHNFFVYSDYKDMSSEEEYRGVLGNFWKVEVPQPTPQDSTLVVDTGAIKFTQPKALKLYDNLLKSGFTETQLGTPDDFIKAVSDSTKAMRLYASLRKAGFSEVNLGSPKEFKQAFCN